MPRPKKFYDAEEEKLTWLGASNHPSSGTRFHCSNEDLILEKNLSGWHPELLENYNGEL